MTVAELASALELIPVSEADPEREITGGYVGDLLSWVMGRASSGDAWVTIMSNANVVAVATLADTAVVVLAEGVTLSDDIVSLARTKGVNIYGSDKSAFYLCGKIAALL